MVVVRSEEEEEERRRFDLIDLNSYTLVTSV